MLKRNFQENPEKGESEACNNLRLLCILCLSLPFPFCTGGKAFSQLNAMFCFFFILCSFRIGGKCFSQLNVVFSFPFHTRGESYSRLNDKFLALFFPYSRMVGPYTKVSFWLFFFFPYKKGWPSVKRCLHSHSSFLGKIMWASFGIIAFLSLYI